jgi:gliding motility-associated lipoprotein GldH
VSVILRIALQRYERKYSRGRNNWRHFWLGLLLLCACERATTYQRIISLDQCCWPVATVLDFTFQIKDTTQTYDIFLVVSNTQDYPYQNLHVTCYLEDDARHLTHQALKSWALFDLKTGKPLGSGLGRSQKHELSMINDYQFARPGLYTVKLEHFMRTAMLPGLQTIGVKVVPSKQRPQ